jgi:pimeloyl-ACP methyl ester carboxylesterase
MRRFALKYLILRTISTGIGVAIIIANLMLWNIPPSNIMFHPSLFNRALLLGFQTFVISYLGFLIADSVSRFWWSRWRPVDTPSTTVEGMVITLPGGERIHGILHASSMRDNVTPSKGFIIASYGFSDNQFRAQHIAKAFAAAGYTIFTWDYRGRGERKGKITDLQGHVNDLQLLIDHFTRTRMSKDAPIFLLGWSMGGMVSIHAGLTDDRVQKIFAWSTWSDLRKRVLWRIYVNPFSFLRYLLRGELLFASKQFNQAVSPVHFFKNLARQLGAKEKVTALAHKKLFLCHARNDTLVGFDNFKENARWLQLPRDNYLVLKRGSHLMIRKEPILVGLACRHFSRGGIS